METRFAGGGAHVRAVRRSFGVMVTVLAVSLIGVQSGSAASVAPWIHVQNGGFANQAGQTVILRGVDQQGGTGTMSDQFAANLGSNVVRLLVPWSKIETTAPVGGVHTYTATALHAVDVQVAWYQAHNVNVLLDFHQFKWSPYFGIAGAQGIPGWFYSVSRAGTYPKDANGMGQAMADWWTDPLGSQYYTAFVQMMMAHYAAYPNVVGYELFNEPMVGTLGSAHAATQAVIAWEAPIAAAMRQADPARAVFFMLRGGGDNGLLHADFSPFGNMSRMVLDLHDYYNGIYGSGFTPDQEGWVPSWDATHNQNFLDYHGTEYAQELNLQSAINVTRAAGIPLFVGEWGVQTADSGAAAFQSQMLDLLRRYGLSWSRWDIGKGDPFTLLNADNTFNAMGLGVRAALAQAAPSALAPADDVAPTASGFAQVTQTLTADQGLWSGVPAPTVAYQWQRCDSAGGNCIPIAGATGSTYGLTSADLGSTVRAQVTAVNASGSASASTPVTGVVSAFVLTIAGASATTSPVSPAITISFSLNKACAVTIVIRNGSGAIVKHLQTSGSMTPGDWVKKWGRTLDTGATAPTGTYTVSITATTSTESTSAWPQVTL